MIFVADALRAISDQKSLSLFKTIASSSGSNSGILLSKMRITTKQYYRRLSDLTKAGLVKRENGRYTLTLFGAIMYETECLLEKAANENYVLKVIESIESAQQIPREEFSKVVDALIKNSQIKQILLARNDDDSLLCAKSRNKKTLSYTD
jgi:hypothetical protein